MSLKMVLKLKQKNLNIESIMLLFIMMFLLPITNATLPFFLSHIWKLSTRSPISSKNFIIISILFLCCCNPVFLSKLSKNWQNVVLWFFTFKFFQTIKILHFCIFNINFFKVVKWICFDIIIKESLNLCEDLLVWMKMQALTKKLE